MSLSSSLVALQGFGPGSSPAQVALLGFLPFASPPPDPEPEPEPEPQPRTGANGGLGFLRYVLPVARGYGFAWPVPERARGIGASWGTYGRQPLPPDEEAHGIGSSPTLALGRVFERATGARVVRPAEARLSVTGRDAGPPPWASSVADALAGWEGLGRAGDDLARAVAAGLSQALGTSTFVSPEHVAIAAAALQDGHGRNVSVPQERRLWLCYPWTPPASEGEGDVAIWLALPVALEAPLPQPHPVRMALPQPVPVSLPVGAVALSLELPQGRPVKVVLPVPAPLVAPLPLPIRKRS